ncbi:MAG: hypothetical protein ABID84_06045 [Chloroflexota bacterium]
MPQTLTYRLSARGQPITVPEYVAFESSAGQRLRIAPDKWDRFLNRYQRELVREYDVWARETQRLVLRATAGGRTVMQIQALIQGRAEDLQARLIVLGHARIAQAGGMGLGRHLAGRIDSPGVRQAIALLQAANDQFLATNLIPDIVKKASGVTVQGLDTSTLRLTLGDAFKALRSRVAGYAGGATVAIFDVQRIAGGDLNRERQMQGQRPFPVRWVLDPAATSHCDDDPSRGTHGCIRLAGVYPGGWDELPTVPAGHVTCLGHCRCHLEADFGRGWERA